MAYKQKSPISIAQGGTNSTATEMDIPQGVIVYNGTRLIPLPTGTFGEVLTSNGPFVVPTFQSPSSGGVSWNDVNDDTVNMSFNNGYVMDNGATLITATLPLIAPFGSIISVAGYGSGLWTIAQRAGQTIYFGAQATTTGTGGSLSSNNQFDQVSLLCVNASTEFVVIYSVGNLTLV